MVGYVFRLRVRDLVFLRKKLRGLVKNGGNAAIEGAEDSFLQGRSINAKSQSQNFFGSAAPVVGGLKSNPWEKERLEKRCSIAR